MAKKRLRRRVTLSMAIGIANLALTAALWIAIAILSPMIWQTLTDERPPNAYEKLASYISEMEERYATLEGEGLDRQAAWTEMAARGYLEEYARLRLGIPNSCPHEPPCIWENPGDYQPRSPKSWRG